jgi:hypothetical protein
LQEWWSNVLKWLEKPLGMNLDFKWWTAGKLAADQKFQNKLNELLGINRRDDNDYRNLRESKDFISTTKWLINTKYRDDASFAKREELFNQRLKNPKNKMTWIEKLDEKLANYFWKEQTLQFMNKDWFKLLHEELGGWNNDVPKDYASFVKNVKNKVYQPKD